jgi:cysteine-S-conjugate beta-lyase
VTAGRETRSQRGFVNPPIVRGSTVLFPSAEDLLGYRGEFLYGRLGTPTTQALCEALEELEGSQCAGVGLAPSGLAALSIALLAVLRSGGHLLVADNVYGSTRRLCDGLLARFGIDVEYFDPLDLEGIAALFRPDTRAVMIEAPGSLSFEVPDVAAVAAIAHVHAALVIDDNTWATPLFHRSLEHGVDISVQSVTKYIGGHSDIMLGAISANAAAWPLVSQAIRLMGSCASSDDAFLALRGLRTLALRLEQHQRSALELAQWLTQRPEVARILYPAIPSDPGYALWKRDFSGAPGLFSVVLQPVPRQAVHAFVDALRLFGIGYSWGGYESLVMPFDCAAYRKVMTWKPSGPTLRLHVGLESVSDLEADLERGFAAMHTDL